MGKLPVDESGVVFEFQGIGSDTSGCAKPLDAGSKAALKAALSSMMLVAGAIGVDVKDAFATTTLPTIPVDGWYLGTGYTASWDDFCYSESFCLGSSAPEPSENYSHVGQLTVDGAGKKIHCAIKKANYNNQEYIAFAYRDNTGAIQTTPLFAGYSSAMVADALRADFPGMSVCAAAGTVITMEHNHPANLYSGGSTTSQPAVLNRAPSQNDWDAYNGLLACGADHVGQYIVGPDGALRWFSDTNQTAPTAASRNVPKGVSEPDGC